MGLADTQGKPEGRAGHENRRWLKDWPARRLAWIAAGAAGASGLVLNDLDSLLGSVAQEGVRSFGTAVFTGPNLPWLVHGEFRTALRAWDQAGVESVRWVMAHLFIDAVFFVPAICMLFLLMMGRVGVLRKGSIGLVITLATVDWIENLITAVIVAWAQHLLDVVPYVSGVKWLVVVTIVAVIVTSYVSPDVHGPSSAGTTLTRTKRTLTGEEEPGPAVALRTSLIVLAVFLGFVAIPAGGPLEQLPDVLRAQLSRSARVSSATATCGRSCDRSPRWHCSRQPCPSRADSARRHCGPTPARTRRRTRRPNGSWPAPSCSVAESSC